MQHAAQHELRLPAPVGRGSSTAHEAPLRLRRCAMLPCCALRRRGCELPLLFSHSTSCALPQSSAAHRRSSKRRPLSGCALR